MGATNISNDGIVKSKRGRPKKVNKSEKNKQLEEENERLRTKLAESRELNDRVTEYAIQLEKHTLFPTVYLLKKDPLLSDERSTRKLVTGNVTPIKLCNVIVIKCMTIVSNYSKQILPIPKV